MSSNSVQPHRIIRSTTKRLYRAFLDADAWAKWLPPHGFTGKVHLMEARVGGRYGMSFSNFIPAEACYLGWQASLQLLTQLVEPEIPG